MRRPQLRVFCLQAAPAVPPHLQNEKDVLLRQLAPLHISRDYLYQASERTSGRAMTTGARDCSCGMGACRVLVVFVRFSGVLLLRLIARMLVCVASSQVNDSLQVMNLLSGVCSCLFCGHCSAGRHSTLAINLTSVPTFPKDALTMFWHRPRR
jgi:succinate dehydrogenase/fumarate reductase-like Fe-S protein